MYFLAILEFQQSPSILVCSGDEDRSTQGIRRQALARALRAEVDVTVDLRELAFTDTSLLLDLAMLSNRLRRRGRLLRLLGARPAVMAMIEHVGLHRLPGVRVDQPTAVA